MSLQWSCCLRNGDIVSGNLPIQSFRHENMLKRHCVVSQLLLSCFNHSGPEFILHYISRGLQVKLRTFIGFESLNSFDPAPDPVTVCVSLQQRRQIQAIILEQHQNVTETWLSSIHITGVIWYHLKEVSPWPQVFITFSRFSSYVSTMCLTGDINPIRDFFFKNNVSVGYPVAAFC